MSHVFYGISYYTGSTKFTFNTGLEIIFVPLIYFKIKEFILYVTPTHFWKLRLNCLFVKKNSRSLIIELTKKLREIL